ncbi:MAG: hypothetical protein RQ763_03075 [Sulfurimonas sp.]|uniref:hypothetical protein n=1 Tax=Sulfurimonas sp. TaxID=2022749 RepID=UPI0028CC3BA7|nr:hypothetical protein [Sulfurimonas sp.]MDT8338164.1 hypothetical protein [Sulfurimonas sp.]
MIQYAMLYIVTALKSEAQAFVEKYRLTKTNSHEYTVFEGEELRVIVSGVGVESAKKAASFLLKNFAVSDKDIFINVGICGANKEYNIGTLLAIGSIIHKDKSYSVSTAPNAITCVDEEVSQDFYILADMESFGFYEAIKEMQNYHIFKVVSDHFEPESVTKDATKKLILSAIDAMMREVRK